MNEKLLKKFRQIPLTSEYNKLVSSAVRNDNELAQHQKYMLSNKRVTSCFLPLSQTAHKLTELDKQISELN